MPAQKGPVKKTTAKKTTSSKSKGAVDDRYFAEQTPDKQVLLERLRALVMKALPDAEVSIKWGVPFYQTNGRNICALAAFKEHVSINLFGPPDAFVDPGNRLEGGKSNRALKVRTAADIDSASVTRWVKAAAAANSPAQN